MTGPESTPVGRLERWELFGAIWRLRSLEPGEALVDLCTCDGALVDQLRCSPGRASRRAMSNPHGVTGAEAGFRRSAAEAAPVAPPRGPLSIAPG